MQKAMLLAASVLKTGAQAPFFGSTCTYDKTAWRDITYGEDAYLIAASPWSSAGVVYNILYNDLHTLNT